MPAERGRALTLGTAGHVDHGKTALVGALTGTDTDRLAEEKRRGISIELGFAELALPSGRRIGVVDVPGHERLVRTMVAGATGIDVFLLVVAADDGVMPQTVEHLRVLRALGVDRGVFALSRCDLADDETRRLAAEEVAALDRGAPVVPVSARSGQGLDELRARIDAVAAEVETASRARAPDAEPPGLLHVDRSFSLRGIGTVVTGTVAGSGFDSGGRVWALPAKRRARLRSIQVHGREVEAASPGARAALNLAGISTAEVHRGSTISAAPIAWPGPSYRLDVRLLPAAEGQHRPRERRVQVHHGTGDAPARIVDLGGGLAQLRLESPLQAVAGDRIVLRRIAPPDTLAGAEVIHPLPPRHRDRRRVEHLQALLDAEPEEILLSASALTGDEGVAAEPREWWSNPDLAFAVARFPLERWREAIAGLENRGAIDRKGDRLRDPSPQHPRPAAERPAEIGPRERLVLAALAADGLEPRATGPLAEALGLEREATRRALDRLVEAGRLERIKPEVHYPPERLRGVERLVLSLAERNGSVSLGELRDAMKTSRKYAQAILEHLDRSGLTVRHGDRHLPRRLAPPGRAG